MKLICTSTDMSAPTSDTKMQVRNVVAALNKGIRSNDDEYADCHYLDGIKSCGDNLQELIRTCFFSVIQGVSDFFPHAEKSFILELLSCLDWNFKARDFENLMQLKVFKLLHTGVPKAITASAGSEGEENKKQHKQNIVLELWQLMPNSELTKELQVITSNLYMGIVSRLAEPEARKIIFSKTETEKTGIGSL